MCHDASWNAKQTQEIFGGFMVKQYRMAATQFPMFRLGCLGAWNKGRFCVCISCRIWL